MRHNGKTSEERIIEKHQEALHQGFRAWPSLAYDRPPAMGDARWTADLILATWIQAETGRPPDNGLEYRVGRSGGGFDVLTFKFLPGEQWVPEQEPIDTAISLNRRPYDRKIEIPVPWYGAGMSFGSICAPIIEFKYAQGAKPGLGGHLLGDKTTASVAKMRESVPWVSLFSPFPFHSVYSVEDHKKHIDWVKVINPNALV